MGWYGLGWYGLGWYGLGWSGLGWSGLARPRGSRICSPLVVTSHLGEVRGLAMRPEWA